MNKLSSRRSFIKNSAFGLSGVAVLPHITFSDSSTHNQKRVGIALVGLGYYSTDVLAPALQETKTAFLAGIVTGSPEKKKIWGNKYNIQEKNMYDYNNFDDIAENKDIDIVYVVLPNSMHKEFTIRAAEAGKHVICEKPMAMNAQECREMIAACKKNNVKLSVGYRMHFDPHTQEVMRLGQEKVYGDVLHISCGAAYRNTKFNHWKWEKEMGGGAMMDMGVYALQGARYVTGEEPLTVTAQSFAIRPDMYKEVDEATTFQLEFPGKAIANCNTGFHASFNYLHVAAKDGWFELNPFSGYGGIKGRTSRGELNLPNINQQAAQMDEVAQNVLNNEPVRVPGEEGLKDMIVVDGIYESIRTGKKIHLAGR